MMMSEMRVMKTDVTMLAVVEFWRLRKNWTMDWLVSNVVCLQVKAMVKPRVMRISVFNCRLNSRL